MTSPAGSAVTVYVAPELFAQPSVELTGDTYRHLFRARRLAAGDDLRVVDGCGRVREGRVAQVDRQSARVALGESLPSRESVRRLSLFVAAPKPERASWLVEKATELGACRIAWLVCERSVRRFSDSIVARHGRIAVSALEQCGRDRLPMIDGPHEWERIAELVEPLDRWWVLDPEGESLRAEPATREHVGLVVGPEGGWTEAERSRLKTLGGAPWTLGERVLRVETAALAATAQLLTSG